MRGESNKYQMKKCLNDGSWPSVKRRPTPKRKTKKINSNTEE